ncbi:MAG: hypothetical protein NT051_03595 [Candidatus Micrarchaeota archaeon]|nr:hypothetical protein [Candidatus Micrarchaeota archaeon]
MAMNQKNVSQTARAYFYLGEARLESGKPRQAAIFFRKALKSDENYSLARIGLAEALYQDTTLKNRNQTLYKIIDLFNQASATPVDYYALRKKEQKLVYKAGLDHVYICSVLSNDDPKNDLGIGHNLTLQNLIIPPSSLKEHATESA